MKSTLKYQIITNTLIEELDQGKFHQGDLFYSEKELCNKFNVSSTTAIKVLNLLQEKNRVTRIQGKGTFVAKEEHKQVVLITDLNMSQSASEGVKVLSVKIGNDSDILTELGLDNSKKYIKIVRVRYIDAQPSQFSINYIDSRFINIKNINKTDLFSSVYQRIREDSGIDPYKLPYSQKNIAKNITNTQLLKKFNKSQNSQIFICQFRRTYLPNTQNSLLEYAISYKLPQYWGYVVNSASGIN